MFQRMIDDLKDSTGNALRLMSLAGAAVVAAFMTILFLCAAAFVFVLQDYGLIQACLTGAAIFFLVALIAVVTYEVRKNSVRKHAVEHAKSAAHSALADPMVLAAGLQIVRAIGIKKLIPILAVGGLALGLFAGRHGSDEDDSSEP